MRLLLIILSITAAIAAAVKAAPVPTQGCVSSACVYLPIVQKAPPSLLPTKTPAPTPTPPPPTENHGPPTDTPIPTTTRTPIQSPIVLVTAWVSDPTPAQYSSVTVYGNITVGGSGVVGVPMDTTWHYRTTTSYCSGTSGSDGTASCSRSIGRATIGYTVWIDVNLTYQGQAYHAQTSFTPQ